MNPIYESPWHHPFVSWVCTALLLLVVVRRLPFLYGYLVVFGVTLLADATVTGAWSPVPRGTTAYTVFSVIFIVLGDLRYFLLVERWAKPKAGPAAVLLVATLASLVVPITTGVMTRTIPAMQDDRVLYVVYEGAMVFLMPGFAWLRLRDATSVDPAMRRATVAVAAYFATLYAGWALSDVAILAGHELGHLARIVPNVLYYGGYLPFVLYVAPLTEKPQLAGR